MISKVFHQDIKKMLNQCQIDLTSPNLDIFYNTHSWDGGYESFHGYNGTREEFYSDQAEMFAFLHDYFQSLTICNCIIAPLANNQYFESWSNLGEVDIYRNIVEVLKKYSIRTNSHNGIKICLPEDFWIIKRFVEGGFRYISKAYLFFPEHSLVIEPHHHMNLLVYANEGRTIDLTLKLLNKYPNLGFYPC